MRLLLTLMVCVVGCCLATPVRPWTLVDLPGSSTQWLATWPGVRGIMLLSADTESAVTNRLTVHRVASGYDRTTGLAVWPSDLNSDLLVYVNSYDEHRVWRYQIDPATWRVRGQLQMQSPQHPLGVSLSADGETACVSGDSPTSRVVQCYRIARALDDDGVTINEWWVLKSNFQWDGSVTQPRPEALLFDSRALPTDVSPHGSVWIDSKLSPGNLVRFPMDSLTGAFMPSTLVFPTALPEQRLVWSTAEASHVIVSEHDAYTIDWSETQNAPAMVPAEPLFETVDSHTHLKAVVWREAALDNFDRLTLGADNAVITITFDRTPEALAVGEIAATPSPLPSASQAPSHMPTPSGSPAPTHEAVPVISDKTTKKHGNSDSLEGLWALVTLVLPLCCVPCIAFVAWKKRDAIRRLLPRQHANDLKPYEMFASSLMVAEQGFQFHEYYDSRTATSVAIPRTESSPLIG